MEPLYDNEKIVDDLLRKLELDEDMKDKDMKDKDMKDKDMKDKDSKDKDLKDQFPKNDFESMPSSESCSRKEVKDETDDEIIEKELKERDERMTEEQIKQLREEANRLKGEGNERFKANDFEGAYWEYTLSIKTCPLQFAEDRAILYCNRAAAKTKLNEIDSAIKDCSKAIELNNRYPKAYSRRASLYVQKDKLDEAMSDYKEVLTMDATHKEALKAIRDLPPKIEERNEKLKTEMLGKLKDLGNIVLKPFGLSTDNFKVNQDANTGSYSINFKQ